MKKLVGGLAVAVAMLLPGAAFAGSSTDAALGLGAFAVFNQILGGIGIFGRPGPVVAAPAPVVYAPPPVVYAPPPPPPYYVAPQPRVVYAPAPPVGRCMRRHRPCSCGPLRSSCGRPRGRSWSTEIPTGSVRSGVTAAGNNLPRRGGTGGRMVRSPVPFLQRLV